MSSSVRLLTGRSSALPCRGRAVARCVHRPSATIRPLEVLVNMSVRSILLLVAVVLFVLAAVGVGLGGISLVPLGLAFFAAAFLLGEGGLNLRT